MNSRTIDHYVVP